MARPKKEDKPLLTDKEVAAAVDKEFKEALSMRPKELDEIKHRTARMKTAIEMRAKLATDKRLTDKHSREMALKEKKQVSIQDLDKSLKWCITAGNSIACACAREVYSAIKKMERKNRPEMEIVDCLRTFIIGQKFIHLFNVLENNKQFTEEEAPNVDIVKICFKHWAVHTPVDGEYLSEDEAKAYIDKMISEYKNTLQQITHNENNDE